MGNATGILVNSGLPVISGNTLIGNQTAIALNGGTGTISSNSILGNGTGIQVGGFGTNPLIINNIVAGNGLAIHIFSGANPIIHANDIGGNTFGVQNDDSSVIVDATVNYWGAPNGPSQAATGSGDKVSGYVNFSPFLTVAVGTTTNQFQVLLVTPSVGGNSGRVTVQVYGTGFQNGASLALTAAGQPDVVGSNTQSNNLGFTLTSTMDLRGAAPGLRNVVVTNPGGVSTTMPGALTVEQGGAPNVAVSLIGRSVMRAAQPQLYLINVLNNGTVDGGQERVWIAFPSYVSWQSPQQAASSSGQLGGTAYVAFDVANAGVGSSVQIPILLTAPDNPGYAHHVFQVQAWKEGK
jgi:parallel beta-helix repeat protein